MNETPKRSWADLTEDEKNEIIKRLADENRDMAYGDWIGQDGRPL